jgi:CBS-domain-containing membrane protein
MAVAGLDLRKLTSALTLPAPGGADANQRPRLALSDPARTVMTDFRTSPVVTVPAGLAIDRALELMMFAGVRFAFVVGEARGVVGAVSAQDIQGEKPARYLQSIGADMRAHSRREVLAQHIMEPIDEWLVVEHRDIARVTLAHVVAALKAVGRRHLVVVETSAGGAQTLRGLLAASRIEQETGLVIDVGAGPRSFAEIERAVEHPGL